ncbi:ABC transporter permease [Spirosoma soli]|uniref:ABC transporter permease n=1 Tax=Spirosoma soli TaxID=1770529 RepID=A0ABW5LZT6_9BACT
MLHNYFTISKRNLWRNRTVSAISVLGLAIGLACGLLIFLLVSYFFSFDRYHANADRTFWVVTDVRHEGVMPTDAAPRPMAEALRRAYPFVESAVRLETIFGRILSVPDGKGKFLKKFEESRNICFTEPQYFDVFDVSWVVGDAKTALAAPNTIVLSERYVQKYFGSENPMGRTLRFDNQTNLTVTGVIRNPPSNTQLRFDALVSYATLPGLFGNDKQAMQDWKSLATMCFVTLREGASVDQLTSAFPKLLRTNYTAADAKTFTFHALPLSDLAHERSGPAPRGILYALIVMGLFLVSAACIYFVNITTAQALKRSKEIGVRKVVGSTRWQLVLQFLIETSLITLAAVGLALLLTQLCLPMLNRALAMLNADLSVLDLFRPRQLLWFIGLVLLVILLSGLYPALVQAGFNPIAALRGRMTTQQVGKVSVRKGLVIVQFFITQLFIFGILVVMAQLRYIRNADLGFRKDAVLMIPMPSNDPIRQETLRSRMLEVPGVAQVALCDEPPASYRAGQTPFRYDTHTEPEKFAIHTRAADRRYAAVFGLKLVAGRNFLTNDTTSQEVVVNEKLVKQLGLPNARDVLGKQLHLGDKAKTIVGVVSDFYTSDFRQTIQPLALVNDVRRCPRMALTINPADVSKTLSQVDRVWNELFTEQVFKPQFVDELVAGFYVREQILLGLAQAFSIVAILLGCLGLYGLVTFIAESKTKEFGVRKVLGASANQLLWVFGREFSKLILVSFVLAAPLGWWLMSRWLQGYAYHINVGWWVFAGTMSLITLITVLTVGRVAFRTALANPVTSLRVE